MCRNNTRAISPSIIFEYFEYSIAQGGGGAQGVLQHRSGVTVVLLGDALGPALVPSKTKPSRSETEADLNQINTRPNRHCNLAEAKRIQSDREAICARSIPENTVVNPKQTSIENLPTQNNFEADLKRSMPRVIVRQAGTDRFQSIS